MRQVETSADSVDSTGKWPVAAAFVVGVLLLAAATRDAAEAPRAIVGDAGSRTAAHVRIVQLSAVLVAATDAETCSQGYVITGDAGFLVPYDRALEVEAEEMEKLEALYAGDLERGPLLAQVREALASQRAHMSRSVSLRRALGAGDPATLIAEFRGRELTDSLRVAIKVIVVDEQSALSRDRARMESASLLGTRNLLVSAGGGLVLVALGLGAVIRKRGKSNSPPTDPVRNALDGPREQVYVLDASGVVRDLHAAAGSAPIAAPHAMLGRPLVDSLPPLPAEIVTQALREVGDSGVSQTVKYEGGSACCRTHFEAVVVPTGGHDLAVVVRDITARVTLEEQLRQVQKMEAVEQLTGGIAHEFSNVLSIIRLNAELLAADGARGVSERAELKEIRAATQRGATMIGQLSSFSRRGMLHRERIDVRVAVSGFLRIIAGMMPKNIRIELGPFDANEAALLDAGALEQMLANLCTNARDAMPDGGTISIDCQPESLDAGYRVSHPWVKPGRYVCVSVSDTGVGMDEATCERIFEPFFTTKDTGSGTGLGLAMVYGMMKDHDGMVHVHSEAGSGTIVKLYFPVAVTVVQHFPVVPDLLDAPLRAS